jgi:hypothetical protein
MPFSPNEFLANAKLKDGFAKNNRFEVMLPIPSAVNKNISNSMIDKMIGSVTGFIKDLGSALSGNLFGTSEQAQNSISANPSISRYLALQCEAAELPGKTLQTADVKIYGPTFKVPYQTQFSDMNLTFICTNEFYERKLFEQWMGCIHANDTWNLRFAKDEETRYLTNITIIQYDEFIKQIYAVELIDAYPVGVAPQSLSWGEEGFHRLSVTFAYQSYRVKYNGEYNIVDAAVSIFGGSAANKLLGGISNRIGNGIGGTIGRAFNRILF